MRTGYEMLEAARKIQLDNQLRLAVFDAEDEFIKLQREQMSLGIRSDDEKIHNLATGSTEYSYSYAKYKGKSSPIDLEDTGDFKGEIFLESEGENFNADSRDEKSAMLQRNYGTEIFGLGEDASRQWHPVVQEKLVGNLTEEMNK